jgi:hypothetical protein
MRLERDDGLTLPERGVELRAARQRGRSRENQAHPGQPATPGRAHYIG